MTKTQARKLASQARRHGYFRTPTTIYNHCPVCKEKVEGDWHPLQGSDIKQHDEWMVHHLMGYCGEGA